MPVERRPLDLTHPGLIGALVPRSGEAAFLRPPHACRSNTAILEWVDLSAVTETPAETKPATETKSAEPKEAKPEAKEAKQAEASK